MAAGENQRPEERSAGRGIRLWRLGVALTLLAGWELAARSVETLLLPTASGTLAAIGRLATSSSFWSALWLTHQALLAGFIAAVLAGVPIGLALGSWPTLGHWLRPHLQVLLVVPVSAVIPLVIMVGGLSLFARGLVVFTFAFPVIAVTAEAGMRNVNARLLDMARSFGATRSQVTCHVRLPAAWPAVVVGLRMGLARAFTGMVVGELILMATGIGGLLLKFQADFDAASVYAVVAVVVVEAVALMRLAAAAEHRLLAWQDRPTA